MLENKRHSKVETNNHTHTQMINLINVPKNNYHCVWMFMKSTNAYDKRKRDDESTVVQFLTRIWAYAADCANQWKIARRPMTIATNQVVIFYSRLRLYYTVCLRQSMALKLSSQAAFVSG